MTKNTVKFLFWIVIVYVAILSLAAGFTGASTPIVSLTAIPLFIVAVLLIRNLTGRATEPTLLEESVFKPSILMKNTQSQLDFLARQIDAAVKSSSSYYDDIIRVRLRELIVTRASIEKGVDPANIRQILMHPDTGPTFLHDDKLYRLLYSRPSAKMRHSIDQIMEATELIENWKS